MVRIQLFELTISHHLQKSLDTGMESYIIQLDFSAAFHRVSHSGLLLKSKYIGVVCEVYGRCAVPTTAGRVVVDGATSE